MSPFTIRPRTCGVGTVYQQLGEYEVVERIGAGGMGEVFRADLSSDGKFVAIAS